MVGGSLCEPLCVKKEVEFIQCLGHGVKVHVLLAEWAGNYVVLKMTEPVSNLSIVSLHLDWYNDHHRLIPKEEFVHKVIRSLCVYYDDNNYEHLDSGKYVIISEYGWWETCC